MSKIFWPGSSACRTIALDGSENEMVDKLNNDQQKFSRDIGKLGVAQSKNKQIPMEVLDEDGNVNCNINVVLEKWKQNFS